MCSSDLEVLFPYLNGEDLNQRPDASASRWVIDFNDRPETEAARFTLPYARVLEQVKPERDKLLGRNPTATDRARNWWKYGRRSPAMRKAIAELSEVLVIARVSKTVMPVRVPTGQVFHEKVVVFATDSYATQAILSSSFHQLWAIKYGTTMRTDSTYTPDIVFCSLPRPLSASHLTSLGRTLDTERSGIMNRRNLGLTKLYNRVNDSADRGSKDIERLREIHVEIDEATMASYGWDDVHLGHGFHSYRQVQRWMVSPAARTEILDRLLIENHRRADEEPKGRLSGRGHGSLFDEHTLFG